MVPKIKIEFRNNYMFFGWLLVLAGLIGVVFCLTIPGSLDAVLGFSAASFVCGAFMIYLGYTKKTIFKKKQ